MSNSSPGMKNPMPPQVKKGKIQRYCIDFHKFRSEEEEEKSLKLMKSGSSKYYVDYSKSSFKEPSLRKYESKNRDDIYFNEGISFI